MLKIFKMILVVALAVAVGLFATQYDGYVMVIVAGKSIKMNLAVAVLLIFLLLFILLFTYRLIILLLSIPLKILGYFGGVFSVDKEAKMAHLVADLALGDTNELKTISVSSISKNYPKDVQPYVYFSKLKIIAEIQDVSELEKATLQLDKDSFVYKYFIAYVYTLKKQYGEAIIGIRELLNDKKNQFHKEVVLLAVKIALARKDKEFALELLNRFASEIDMSIKKDLVLNALENATSVTELKQIYNKLDKRNEEVDIAYASKLIKFDEIKQAKKILKRFLATENVCPSALYLYVTAFNFDLDRVSSKVCNSLNKNVDSVLVLLDLALIRSDKKVFKETNDYIEKNLLSKMTLVQKEKHNHILCKFYIKLGRSSEVDISATKLIYDR